MQDVEFIHITKLTEHPQNPRKISSEELGKLINSMIEFPDMLNVRPLIVNIDNEVIGGNMRLKAAKCINADTGGDKFSKVPCIRVTWDYATQKEFMLRDNVHNGYWDVDKLRDLEMANLLYTDTSAEVGTEVNYSEGEVLHASKGARELNVQDISAKYLDMVFKLPDDVYEYIHEFFESKEGTKEQILLHLLGYDLRVEAE